MQYYYGGSSSDHKETGFARYEKGMVKEAIHRAWEKAKDEDIQYEKRNREREVLEEFTNAMWWWNHLGRWVPFIRMTLPVKKSDIEYIYHYRPDYGTERIFNELLGLIATCDDTHILLSPAAVKVCELDDNLYGRLP